LRRFQPIPQSARASASMVSRYPAFAACAHFAARVNNENPIHRAAAPTTRATKKSVQELRSNPRETRSFPYLHPFDSARCHA
jgi:hypothetical protein